MGEWELGLGWVLVALLAIARPRPAETAHARPTGSPPGGRLPADLPAHRPARAGWPPGVLPPPRTGPPGRPGARPAAPFALVR